MNKEIQKLVKDIESILSSSISSGKSQAVEITDEIRSEVLKKIDQIQGHVNTVQDKASDWTNDIEKQTKEHPWSMLMGATAIGLLAGLLIRRD